MDKLVITGGPLDDMRRRAHARKDHHRLMSLIDDYIAAGNDRHTRQWVTEQFDTACSSIDRESATAQPAPPRAAPLPKPDPIFGHMANPYKADADDAAMRSRLSPEQYRLLTVR